MATFTMRPNRGSVQCLVLGRIQYMQVWLYRWPITDCKSNLEQISKQQSATLRKSLKHSIIDTWQTVDVATDLQVRVMQLDGLQLFDCQLWVRLWDSWTPRPHCCLQLTLQLTEPRSKTHHQRFSLDGTVIHTATGEWKQDGSTLDNEINKKTTFND